MRGPVSARRWLHQAGRTPGRKVTRHTVNKTTVVVEAQGARNSQEQGVWRGEAQETATCIILPI